MKVRNNLLLLLSFLPGIPLQAKSPDPKQFKVEVLAEGFMDPQEMVILPDGRILICQRTGELKVWTPAVRALADGGKLEVAIKVGSRNKEHARECGFLGITADPDFAKNQWIYCYYSPKEPSIHRLSRFAFREGKLDMTSEKMLLEVPTERYGGTCHEGGSMAFGPDGFLYLSTGDNTCPFSKEPTPIEEKKKQLDAQRSASNSNDLRGKILRIDPQNDGTYRIPVGNLFKPGTPKTRPEIYAMGLRNPYRITLNSKTGTLYWNEVAPDKTPTGEEINQAKSAGYYGWPYVITDSKPFNNREGVTFDPKKLRNNSINNTGLVELPVPRDPLYFYNRSCSIIGGIYHKSDQAGAFPDYYDNCLFFADWNRSWFKAIRLDKDEKMVAVEEFALNHKFRKPIEMFFHQGMLYVLEYGDGWYDVDNGRLTRVSYSASFNQKMVEEQDVRIIGMKENMPGVKLIQATTCLSCHSAQGKVIGPSFVSLATKYGNDAKAPELLFKKIRSGGVGVWGEQPMPPHPLNTDEEVKQMVAAILSTRSLEEGHKK